MLRLQKLANVNKRRTLRAMYAQTQAYPYAATLDAGVNRADTDPFSGTEAGKAAIWPGMVAVKTTGESVDIASGGAARGFGLFANFVGGELDELGDRNEVGVWRGPGAVFEVLAPVIGGTVAGAADPDQSSHSDEVFLVADSAGRLEKAAIGDTVPPFGDDTSSLGSSNRPVARLVERLSSSAIVVELLV